MRRNAPVGIRPHLEALERRDLLTSYVYSTPEDTLLTVTDSTMAGATIVAAPAHGKVSFAATGGFVYSPAENYNGSDGFTFSINPPTGTLPPTTVNDVSITITPVNDAPKAYPDQFAAQENTTLSVDASGGVLKNDVDVDGDKLTAILVNKPTHGTLQLGDGGGFSYVPATDYFGPDSFTYKDSDNQATSDATTAYLYVAQNKPVAKDDYYGVAQNGTLNIAAPGVLANDTGVNGRSMTASLESNSGPQHGTVTVNADGSFTYTPATDYVGDDSFVYRATDNSPAANPLPAAYADATVHISVHSTAPIVVAANDSYTAQEATTLSIAAPGVLGNDKVYSADATNSTANATVLNIPLNSVLVTGPSHGTLTLNADGSFSYRSIDNYVGGDSFTYRAVMMPAAGATTAPSPNPISHDVATVSITVVAPNTPPAAQDDNYGTPQDTQLNIAAPGVLGNDKHIDGHKLAATLVDNAGHGTLTLNADGSFSYMPAGGYVGPDSFTYTATDTSAVDAHGNPLVSNVAKVSIYVRSTAPIVIANNDTYYAFQGLSLNIAAKGVLANDVVYSADATNSAAGTATKLDIPLAAKLVTGASHGDLTLNADGSFTYTPKGDFTGADTFTYQALLLPPSGSTTNPPDNPQSHDTATVTIYVKTPIVANNDTYSVQQNVTLNIAKPGVLANDYLVAPFSSILQPSNPNINPPTNQPLFTATLISGPADGTGTVKLNADGSFTFSPATDFVGTATFTYQDSLTFATVDADGAPTQTLLSNVATVTINVKLPTPVATNDYFKVVQGGTIVADPPGVLANDKGADGSKLAAVLDASTSNGQLSLTAAGGFTYTPDPTFSGLDKFTYHVIDTNSTTSPPATSNVATVTIFVEPLHPLVYANPDYYGTLAGTALSITAPGVLGNDNLYPPTAADSGNSTSNGGATNTTIAQPIPPKGDYTFSAAIVTNVDPSTGTLDFHSDGSFTFTPATGFSGSATFSYQATATANGATGDGTTTSSNAASSATANIATVTIYVKQPEPPPGPVANNDYFLTAENTELDIHAPGVLTNDYLRGLVPPPQPLGGTAINQPLTPFTAILVSGPADGTGKVMLNADGSFAFVPFTDFVGLATFTYQDSYTTTASDGTTTTLLSNVATVTIKVVPAIARPDAYQVQQDTTLTVAAAGVLTNDLGGSTTNPLTATPLNGPLHGQLSLNADGSFKYQPAPGYSGPDMFTYRATADASATAAGESSPTNVPIDVGIVKIYVMSTTVPRSITANDDKYTVNENDELDVDGPGVLANDNGPVNVPVVATLVHDVQHGALVLNVDGGFSYTPDDDYTGEDQFTYTASAAAAGSTVTSSTATVTIYVLGTNATPQVIVGDNQKTTDESGPQNVPDFAAVPVNDAGQPASVTVTTDHPELFKVQPTIDATGQLIFTPAPNVSGDAIVTVITHNPAGDTTQTFTIHIDKPHVLHNADISTDVTDDGTIAPEDAVAVLTYLNAHGSTSVTAATTNGASGEGEGGATTMYMDVSGDDMISPTDVVMIISDLNAGKTGAAEGEGAPPVDSSLLALVAQDTAEATTGRKRVT